LSAGISENDFGLGPGNSESINNLELFGKTRQSDIAPNYRLKRGRTHSCYLDSSIEEIEFQLRIRAFDDDGNSGLDDIVENLSMIFTYDVLNEESKVLNQGDVKLISGQFKKGAEVG